MSEFRPELEQSSEIVDLLTFSFGGIKKTLYYVRGSEDQAWISVEDNKGDNFTVDIPKKEDMPEGENPFWMFNHAMLFGPEVNGRGNIYSAPEGS